MEYSEFANMIRKRRKGMELTLNDVAEKVGVSVPYLSELERGQKQPPIDGKVDRLAQALDLDPAELRRLATLGRRRVEIDVAGESAAKLELVTLLARRSEDGGVTEAEALDLIKRIEDRRGGKL